MKTDLETGCALKLQPDEARYTWAYFLEDVTARFQDSVAIRFEGRDITYQELQADAKKLAKALAAAGVVKGMRVAVHMANRPEFAVVSFAVAQVGAVLIPINTFATAEEQLYILRHSDASVLIFQAALLKKQFVADFLAMVPEAAQAEPGKIYSDKVPYLRRAICLGLDTMTDTMTGAVEAWQEFMRIGEKIPDTLLAAMTAEVFPSDEGVMIYTSGTTSHPKGVLHMQRAPTMQSWSIAEYMKLSTEDIYWSTYPFFWSAGFSMYLGGCLAAGCVLVLQETFEPAEALKCLAREKVTTIVCWPHQSKAMAVHPLLKTLDLSSLKKVSCETPMAAALGLTDDLWGTQGSYGMTETFTFISNLPADAAADKRLNTAGKILSGVACRILDKETGAPLAQGETGEIAVKGMTLMRGYYKVNPENYLDENGYFHTQDGGYIDELGYLHWTGRLSNMIKTAGANVSPLEIEKMLQNFPNLRVSFPFGVPHPTLGEVIVLCVVAIKGQQLDETALELFLRSKLAAYKRPKKVLLFTEDELSFTGNQKIQLDKLEQKALQRLRDEAVEIEGVNYGERALSV